jgi:hypothetical protein
MLEINTPAGAPPRDLLNEAMREVIGQTVITASVSERPPQLMPSITRARVAQELDDVDDLVRALRDIAHAAIASIVRVRAAAEEAS